MMRRIVFLIMLIAAAAGCSSRPAAPTESTSTSNASSASVTEQTPDQSTTTEAATTDLGPFVPRGAGEASVETPDGYVGTARATWSAVKVVTQEQVAALPCWLPPNAQVPEGKFTYQAVHVKMSFTPGTKNGFTWPATEMMKETFGVKPNPFKEYVDSQYVVENRDGIPCTDARSDMRGDLQNAASTEEGYFIWYSELTPNQPNGQWAKVTELAGMFQFEARPDWKANCASGWQGSYDLNGAYYQQGCLVSWGAPK